MVSQEVILFRLSQHLYTSMFSSPNGRLFYYEQPHLPVAGPVHPVVESFSKPFGHFSLLLTQGQLNLADIAFVATNLT
jgi:hypothetical protein